MRSQPKDQILSLRTKHLKTQTETPMGIGQTKLPNNHEIPFREIIYDSKRFVKFHISYEVMVEEALCFGWIDSLPRALDQRRTMIRLSPRKPKSAWSKINRGRVAKLIKSGLMTEAGLRAIKEAKRNGSWDKLKAIDKMVIPRELKNELEKKPKAKKNFNAFPASSKRAIFEWIQFAKTAETKRKRVLETVKLAAKNLRANHYRQSKKVES